MQALNRKVIHILLQFSWVLPLVISGCHLTPYIRQIHEDPRLSVRLENHTGGPFPENPLPFDHPFGLTDDQWRELLRDLTIHLPSHGDPAYTIATNPGTQQAPLFSEEEIALLGSYLAKASSEARSNEWMTFVLDEPVASYRWLNKTIDAHIITSGGCYRIGNTLHVYLANIRAPVTLQSIRDRIWDNPFLVADGHFYQLASPSSDPVTPHRPKGIAKALTLPIYEVVLKMPPHEKRIQSDGLEASSPNMAPAGGHVVGSKLEDKLSLLLSLYQKGLISREDYETSKQALLDTLIDEPKESGQQEAGPHHHSP